MAVVHLGPDLRLAGGLDEPRGHPHAVVLVPHAALEQVVGAQRLAHVAGAQRRALEHQRRPAPQHAETAAAQPAELRDQLLVQAVAEILVALVSQVAEGEHGEPDARRRAAAAAGWRLGAAEAATKR